MMQLKKEAFPGCVVFAARHGRIVYDKAFGHYNFDPRSPEMNVESIFDLASVTKITATTVSVMKLYEKDKLKLYKMLGDYLPWTKRSTKAYLKIEDILLHQAGLVAFIPFYKETIDSATGIPNPAIYSDKEKPGFNIPVAENIYMRNDWNDTMFSRILKSPLGPQTNMCTAIMILFFWERLLKLSQECHWINMCKKLFMIQWVWRLLVLNR